MVISDIIIKACRFSMPFNKIAIKGHQLTGIPAAKPEYFFAGHQALKINYPAL